MSNDIKKYRQLLEDAENSDEHLLELVNHFGDEDDDIETINDLENIDVDEAIDDIVDMFTSTHLIKFLDFVDINYEVFTLPNNEKMMNINNNSLVYNETYYSDIETFIYNLSDDDILEMYDYDFEKWSEDFWNSISSDYEVYHATTEENWETIKDEGIEASNKTRGISNRNTGSAVFVTTNPDELMQGFYGDVHIDIRLGKMKEDGYTPMVSEEKPWVVAELKRSLGAVFDIEIEDLDSSDGISPDTLVIFGDIPPKYIERSD